MTKSLMLNSFKEKFFESFKSIIPIAIIILIVCGFIVPVDTNLLVIFFIGVILLMIGMTFFTNGVDISMISFGSKLGTKMVQSRKVWLISLLSLIIGIVITLTEPDLQILASQVNGVPNIVLMVAVAVGVGVFLVIAMLRILFDVSLRFLLLIFYGALFILCFFVPKEFLAMSFDSGGVTTGPMTVPFLISLGIGVTAVKQGKNNSSDSFGTIALCSVGPIIAVMVLGIFYKASGGEYQMPEINTLPNSMSVTQVFWESIVEHIETVGISVLPIVVFFVLFELVTKSFDKVQIIRVMIGFIFTYVGLVIFLSGASVGFMPIGYQLGGLLSVKGNGYLLIPVGMIIGYFIVLAEPSVYVLTKQVEKASLGAVSAKTMNLGLSIGVSLAIGLSMMRILTGINILWILIPGYCVSLVLTFFVPKLFTGIAFDSGGVASGAMASTFVLPFAIGAAISSKANVFTQAFGCISFIALAPLITVQISGLIYAKKSKKLFGNILLEEDTIIEY